MKKVLARAHLELAVFQGETADVLAVVIRRRVHEVDPRILGELRIEGHAEEPVLLRRRHRDLADLRDEFRLRIKSLHLAGDLVEKDAAIRSLLHRHRLRQALRKDFKVETVVGRRRLLGGDGQDDQREGGDEVSGHAVATVADPDAPSSALPHGKKGSGSGPGGRLDDFFKFAGPSKN